MKMVVTETDPQIKLLCLCCASDVQVFEAALLVLVKQDLLFQGSVAIL